MKHTTKNRIQPIAQSMAKGDKPSDAEVQVLRSALSELRDQNFRERLELAGTETTLRARRETGRFLLSKIRFATGAMLDHAIPGFTRPEKFPRLVARETNRLKRGRLQKLSLKGWSLL
jgi:hypothetical protein